MPKPSKPIETPKRSLLFIEPHPDDAFICAHEHLTKIWPGEYRITILTVFADGKRTKEAQSYAKAIGASSVVLGLEETNMSEEDATTFIQPLDDWLFELDNQSFAHTIVSPVRLQHPDHKSVRDTVGDRACWLYLDTPYQTKLKNKEELADQVNGKVLASIVYPGKRKWAAKEIFKSQSKFFYYNNFEDWKLAELILENR